MGASHHGGGPGSETRAAAPPLSRRLPSGYGEPRPATTTARRRRRTGESARARCRHSPRRSPGRWAARRSPRRGRTGRRGAAGSSGRTPVAASTASGNFAGWAVDRVTTVSPGRRSRSAAPIADRGVGVDQQAVFADTRRRSRRASRRRRVGCPRTPHATVRAGRGSATARPVAAERSGAVPPWPGRCRRAARRAAARDWTRSGCPCSARASGRPRRPPSRRCR